MSVMTAGCTTKLAMSRAKSPREHAYSSQRGVASGDGSRRYIANSLSWRLMAMTLTRTETAKLKALEDVLETARRWAVEEAKALATIKRERLYRARYETFDNYIEQRLGYDRTYAYRISAWGDVLETLSPIGNISRLPQRESHARPLFGLRPDQQQEAWKLVERRLGGQKTAAEITRVVEDYLRPRKPAKLNQQATLPSAEVVCGDALTQVAKLKNGSVDLCFTSPPCPGVRRDFPSVSEREFPSWIVSILEALRPKLKSSASVIINVRERISEGQISDVCLRTRLAIRQAGWKEIDSLIWHKPDAPPNGRSDRPRRTFEFLHWYSLTSDPFVDPYQCGSDAKPQSRVKPKGSEALFGSSRRTHERTHATTRISDVIVAPIGVDRDVEHDAKFPLRLADQIVKTFCPEDGLVVDVCCGSGTTLVAALNSRRRSWGCDILERCCREARRRLRTGK